MKVESMNETLQLGDAQVDGPLLGIFAAATASRNCLCLDPRFVVRCAREATSTLS